jgi:hypothetical protein
MAVGSWFAGALYDMYGYYDPAFGSAVLFNIVNLCIIAFLVVRLTPTRIVGRSQSPPVRLPE